MLSSRTVVETWQDGEKQTGNNRRVGEGLETVYQETDKTLRKTAVLCVTLHFWIIDAASEVKGEKRKRTCIINAHMPCCRVKRIEAN